jgi:hypothetical protein
VLDWEGKEVPMRRAVCLAAIIMGLAAFGCDRERTFPEPRVSTPEERTNLPAVNERIEREADHETRPITPRTAPAPGDRGSNP